MEPSSSMVKYSKKMSKIKALFSPEMPVTTHSNSTSSWKAGTFSSTDVRTYNVAIHFLHFRFPAG
jgi:hypothetical protein